jgi:hypothetical protein
MQPLPPTSDVGFWVVEDLLNTEDMTAGDDLRHGPWIVEDLFLVNYTAAHAEYRLIPHKYHLIPCKYQNPIS